ncbi:MAG: hypothetical protein H6581_04620 [Bacteroidia bacterium]|nr:hypothetical protein [Bacteroidia bacterium]
MAIISNLILAGAGTLIGDYFQKQQARIKEKREQKAEDIKIATKVFREVSVLMESVVYYATRTMKELLLSSQNPDSKVERTDLETNWNAYSEHFGKYSRTRYLNAARINHSFGKKAELMYQVLQEEFEEADKTLFNRYHGFHENQAAMMRSSEDFDKLFPKKRQQWLDQLNTLNLIMTNAILEGKVGHDKVD